MEFLNQNLVNTTTQITLGSNTSLAENLFNPDRVIQYFTDGFGNDATTASITITFSATQTVGRIALLEHNLESFRIFYNGATANTFAIDGATTTANFVSNTASDTYLKISSATGCSSVTIDMRTTISANAEKAIGYLVISSLQLDFPNPNAAGYSPMLAPKQIIHQLSDGGTRIHVVREKWEAKLKFQSVTETERNSFRTVYDTYDPFIFVPFGTHTSWDGILFEAVWTNPFNFYRFTDENPSAGFRGDIDLKETAG